MATIEELVERERKLEAARKRLQARAKRLGVRIDQLKDDRRATSRKARTRREQEKALEEAIAEARRERHLWSRRACIDGATTWLGLKLVLTTVEARTAWGGGVTAADRTSHADDCGDKMSQAELWAGWIHHLPGFFPANPPGTGSHEGICDDDLAPVLGHAIGDELKPWEWGLDLADGPGFEHGAERLGFKVVRVYGNEPWHCNLSADPTPVLKRIHAL